MKRRRINIDLAFFMVGLVLFALGAYLIYPPAALVGSGLIFMGISLFGGRV
jgi:hypothetical protein